METEPLKLNKPRLERVVSQVLISAIESAPLPHLRGMIRAELGLVTQVGIMHSPDEIKRWIVDNYKAQPGYEVMEDGSISLVANYRPRRGSVMVSFSVDIDVRGFTTWARTDTIAGEMSVPVDIVDLGEDDVRDYVRSNYRSLDIERDYGDEERGESEIDSETVESVDVEYDEPEGE